MDSEIEGNGEGPRGEITGISTQKCLDIVKDYIKNFQQMMIELQKIKYPSSISVDILDYNRNLSILKARETLGESILSKSSSSKRDKKHHKKHVKI